MGFKVIDEGIEFSIPTLATINWGPVLETSWRKISGHDHTGAGNGAQISSAGIADGSITSEKLANNISFTQATTLTPAGTTQTVDFDNGNFQTIDLSSATGDVTLTLLSAQEGALYRLKVLVGATLRKVIWPANCKFAGGIDPADQFTANTLNLVYFDYDGTDYLSPMWELEIA